MYAAKKQLASLLLIMRLLIFFYYHFTFIRFITFLALPSSFTGKFIIGSACASACNLKSFHLLLFHSLHLYSLFSHSKFILRLLVHCLQSPTPYIQLASNIILGIIEICVVALLRITKKWHNGAH